MSRHNPTRHTSKVAAIREGLDHVADRKGSDVAFLDRVELEDMMGDTSLWLEDFPSPHEEDNGPWPYSSDSDDSRYYDTFGDDDWPDLELMLEDPYDPYDSLDQFYPFVHQGTE